MLQRRASREEGVLQVVVEQAADGGHVDVGEAREAAREVGGVVVRPEEAPELAVEDVLGLSSVRGRPGGDGVNTRTPCEAQQQLEQDSPQVFPFADPLVHHGLRGWIPVDLVDEE